MGQEYEGLDRKLAEFQASRRRLGWEHPTTQGIWQRLLESLYERIAWLKRWHMRGFPNPAEEGDFDLTVLDALSRGVCQYDPARGTVDQFLSWLVDNRVRDVKRRATRRARLLRENRARVGIGCRNPVSVSPEEREQERIRRWVAGIRDEPTRMVAYYLFVDLTSRDMTQKELAEILGKSDSWVSKKVTMLQDERLSLVQGDNHAGELSA